MNIVYTLNNKFIPQVAAGITSVCENNQDAKGITFYLLHTDISKENQDKLKQYIKTYGRKIVFIKLDNFKKYFDFEFDTNGWNPIILSRLLIGELLPQGIDKILYLDGDTIVRGSLKNLWQTNLSNHIIAASIEPTIDKNRKKILCLENYPYYNSGVLFIDLEKWRKNNIGKQIINYYKDNCKILLASDQDAINGSQKGKIHTLAPKYNSYNIFYQYPYKFLSSLCDFSYVSQSAYKEAKNNPIIVHYLGEERPWRIGNKHKFKDDYLKYLNITPWKNQGLEKGWKLYFACWNCFNVATKPFPKLRYTIINGLIPTFMKIRSRKLAKNHEK